MESIYNAVRHLERQSEPVRGKKNNNFYVDILWQLKMPSRTAAESVSNWGGILHQLQNF